ncbi:MAG: 4-hydroxythreonine-4-phosphate dehydrogenase PdxA [Thermonemataceae bacterium]
MNNKKHFNEHKPTLGITIGDYNGVGPEIILKALGDNRILGQCTPVIYGSSRVLGKYRKLLGLSDWYLHQIKEPSQINYKKTNIINCFDTKEIAPGKITEEAGQAAFKSLETATKDLIEGKLDGIVTAPINKHNIQNDTFNFVGHTEYFTKSFEAKESLMLMVADTLRVALATGHTPLSEVSKKITPALLTKKIDLLYHTLKHDFGINKPKIAVLGLNPHAGEEGLLGQEEKALIEPLIKDFRRKGKLIYGCFPADGFWGMSKYANFDATLALYHDQGLIPFKSIAFHSGVNFTAGLPIVRTSPDHGTAYNIAGKNQADPSSMRQAIYLACDLIKIRKESEVQI